MYSGRSVLTRRLKQKQKFTQETRNKKVFQEKNKKKQKNKFFIKKTKASCQRTVRGEVVNKLGSLRKCICTKYRREMDYEAFLTRKRSNLHICWHMQRSGVQVRIYFLTGVRRDTNIASSQ